MRRMLRRLASPLRRRARPSLSEPLIEQVRDAKRGALLARDMVTKKVPPDQARQLIVGIEHHGDEMRAELIAQLSRTLVAPLDREDLFRLSRALDDILDTIRDFLRESDLYQIESRKTYLPFVETAIEGIDALDAAVQSLWTSPRRVPLKALEAKKAAGTISRRYQKEMAGIVDNLDDASSTYSFKHRELVSRLDLLGSRINEAADVLTDGALKRGY